MNRFALAVLVVAAGICSLGLEMTTLTLLAPYLGTTQVVWATVIGFTLLCLAGGYVVGGRLADRWNDGRLLAALVAAAGLTTTLVPVLARPALLWVLAEPSYARMAQGMVLSLLATVLPLTLLGMVSPFAVKLALKRVDDAGRTSGLLFALSTLGSLLGTFLPVLVLTPLLGASRTFACLGLILSASSMLGLRGSGLRGWSLAVAGAGLALWMLSHPPGPIWPQDFRRTACETQSPYNAIRVALSEGYRGVRAELFLNESGVHSTYNQRYEQTRDPRDLRTDSYWDIVLAAPFLYPDRRPETVTSLAVVGMGAGSTANLFLALFGRESVVEGAEIDGRIVELSREFFGVRDAEFPHFRIHVQDGRVFLNQMSRNYDIIMIDCFRIPYIPGHLVTREAFEQARRHLTPQGVLVVKCDRGVLGRQVASTLRTVFPEVFLVNSLAVAVNTPIGDPVANLQSNAEGLKDPVLREILLQVADSKTDPGRPLIKWHGEGFVLTDDCCPTEALVHLGGFNQLMRRLR